VLILISSLPWPLSGQAINPGQPLLVAMSLELLSKQQPGLINALYRYRHEVFKAGELGVKEKELIAVAVSCLLKCDTCLEMHAREAEKAGATKGELREAITVAMYLAGPSTVIWSPSVDAVLGKVP
jgi:AhpD family alkylhydroperoxidase